MVLHNFSLNYVFNHLKINTAKKALTFKIIYTKKNLTILNILKNLGVIRRFVIIKNKNFTYFKIYTFYYKHVPTYGFIKIMSTPSKSFYISYAALKYINTCTGSSTYLLETSRGIITHNHAMKLKIGGKLFAFITV